MALREAQRIPSGRDLAAVLGSRTFAANRIGMLRYRRNGLAVSRFAFVVSRKAARLAVSRNTLRRRASEWVRKHMAAIAPGFDGVLVFRSGARDAPRRAFPLLLEELFKKTPIL